jgi:hypothetical protein
MLQDNLGKEFCANNKREAAKFQQALETSLNIHLVGEQAPNQAPSRESKSRQQRLHQSRRP